MYPILSHPEIVKAETGAVLSGETWAGLMEKAGRGVADFILRTYPAAERVAVLVGKGRNGGDGYVIARRLFEAGKTVFVLKAFDCPSDELSEGMRRMLPQNVPVAVYSKEHISVLRQADVIVDAVFGVGFRGTLPQPVYDLLQEANFCSAAKIAVDLPSGGFFRADHTLSIFCLKTEQIEKPSSYVCGKVHIVDIGISVPPDSTYYSYTEADAVAALPRRPFDANKGTFGTTLIVAGSYRMPGAAVIAAKGAVHTGAGKTVLAFPDAAYTAVTPHLTETVLLPVEIDENGGFSKACISQLEPLLPTVNAVVIGPGIGTEEGAKAVARWILTVAACPVVLDADGINCILSHKDILNGKSNVILTPHPGEMARLTGTSPAYVNENRIQLARRFAAATGVTVLLKGANTIVAAPEGWVYINPTGTPAMARGGSGDLLSGVVGALLSQGKRPFEAAALGAYFHGLAGNTAEKRYGPYAATVERITDCLFQ